MENNTKSSNKAATPKKAAPKATTTKKTAAPKTTATKKTAPKTTRGTKSATNCAGPRAKAQSNARNCKTRTSAKNSK